MYSISCMHLVLIRSDIFHRLPAIDGSIPSAGDTSERLEVGPTVWHGPDGLVLDIHRVRVALRAQRLRRDESASLPQPVLMQRRLVHFRPLLCSTRNDRPEQALPVDWLANDDARTVVNRRKRSATSFERPFPLLLFLLPTR